MMGYTTGSDVTINEVITHALAINVITDFMAALNIVKPTTEKDNNEIAYLSTGYKLQTYNVIIGCSREYLL